MVRDLHQMDNSLLVYSAVYFAVYFDEYYFVFGSVIEMDSFLLLGYILPIQDIFSQ
jgi:hypothetical protein